MNKFLFLLGLLYRITCETVKLCDEASDDNPSKSDCFKRELTEEEKEAKAKCCYIKGTSTILGETTSGSNCMALLPDQQSKSKVTEILKALALLVDPNAKVEVKDFSCYGSYLKFGFLLLSLLLL